MPFFLLWDRGAKETYNELRGKAKASLENRQKSNKTKASREEGLFRQVKKCITFLKADPRHPGLHTHAYSAIRNPFNPMQKVFEAYAQQNTPASYRVFWCYGPKKDQITILAITAHP